MEEVAAIFTDIQATLHIPNKHYLTLIDCQKKNPDEFLYSMEQCFLKILSHLSKLKVAPKKEFFIFDRLLENFFSQLKKKSSNSNNNANGNQNPVVGEEFYSLMQYFLEFFANGIENSNTLPVKNFSVKILVSLLKLLTDEELNSIMTIDLIQTFVINIINLMKQKSDIRMLGIKLGSFFQKIENQLMSSEIENLQSEIIRLMCVDEKPEIRRTCILNLKINDKNFRELIQRTREINPEIRLKIYNKLINEGIYLFSKDLGSIYKVIYDGLQSRETSINSACVNYLTKNYTQFTEKKFENGMEIESEVKKKRFSTPGKEQVDDLRNRILNFFGIFQIKHTLVFPVLYQMMEMLTKEFLMKIVPKESFSYYLREILLYNLKDKNGDSEIKVTEEEVFILRVLCEMMQENKADYKELDEFFSILDESFPSVTTFSRVILHFNRKESVLGLYQSLLISEMLLNSDEISRSSLINVLKNLLSDIKNYENELPSIDPELANDLFYSITEEELEIKFYSRSYFETPLIRNKSDLLPIIVRILNKVLSDDVNFNAMIVQTISEVREPLSPEHEESLLKKVELLEKKLIRIEEKTEEMDGTKGGRKMKKRLLKGNKEYEETTEKLNQVKQQIKTINHHCLNLAMGLLQISKLSLKDSCIMGLVNSLIGPLLRSGDESIEKKALHCLALYVILDKKACVEYMKVFLTIFDDGYLFDSRRLKLDHVIAIKAIFDFFMVHRFLIDSNPAEAEIEEKQNDFETDGTIENLSNCLFKSHVVIRNICIEGFCRLLFNDRMKENEDILANLLLIWVSPNLLSVGAGQSIQLLSSFFKTFTQGGDKQCKEFERALETIVLFWGFLNNKGMEFNKIFVFFEINHVFNLVKSGLTLMISDKILDDEDINKDDYEITAFDTFLLFILKVCLSENQSIKGVVLLEKLFNALDFNTNLNLPNAYLVLLKDLSEKIVKNNEFAKNRKIKSFLNFVQQILKKKGIENSSELEAKACELENQMQTEINEKKSKLIALMKTFEENDIIVIADKAKASLESQEEPIQEPETKPSKNSRKRKLEDFEEEKMEEESPVGVSRQNTRRKK